MRSIVRILVCYGKSQHDERVLAARTKAVLLRSLLLISSPLHDVTRLNIRYCYDYIFECTSMR